MEQDRKCQVGVVLGSASDLDKVSGLFKVFDEFQVQYELAIISAHRTPHLLEEYARCAPSKGIQVIIAAAGLRCPSRGTGVYGQCPCNWNSCERRYA